jgi:hypothetical protein
LPGQWECWRPFLEGQSPSPDLHVNLGVPLCCFSPLVSENLRKMIKFFKEKLALEKLTAKNERLASTFWQSHDTITSFDESDKPPG